MSRNKPFREPTPRRREEFAYVLDAYDAEKSFIHRKLKGKITQLLGERYFILLEGLMKEEAEVGSLERVYVGTGPRDKISTILRRIGLRDLTPIAKAEIENAIKKSVELNQERWVEFFNRAGPITKRLHSLELLPGVGKKTMWEVIQKRERALFTSFRDIQERVGMDPVKAIVKRVLEELEGGEKYPLFADVMRKEMVE
ncbi:MAG: DUF655 domain-containing protein [Candidatus Geothermarchaeales archaeon]